MVSQKCQYALRAIFELAKRKGQGAVRIADIAEAQAIPKRFLEVILGQLKQGGFVASQRGSDGGYVLVRSASELSVGDVIRFVQGPVGPVDCLIQDPTQKCPLYGDCVFLAMWQEVADAIAEVYDRTTFQELVDKEARMHRGYVASYSI